MVDFHQCGVDPARDNVSKGPTNAKNHDGGDKVDALIERHIPELRHELRNVHVLRPSEGNASV